MENEQPPVTGVETSPVPGAPPIAGESPVLEGQSGSPQALPFGAWPSSFTAAGVAAGKVSYSGLQADGDSFFWLESRPQDGGRQVVVRSRPRNAPDEVSPPGCNIRSRVHEYGGGAALVSDGVLFFVEQADQRIYRVAIGPGSQPVALTPAPGRSGPAYRYADGRVTSSGRWLVCVEEAITDGGTGHRLVAVSTDGSLRVVALTGTDGFVAAPRVSPAGNLLTWVAWRHPDMPWDRSSVWIADLVESLDSIGTAHERCVSGGGDESVGQPRWGRDGSLLFVGDRTGWWRPYRIPSRVLADGSDTLTSGDLAGAPLVDLDAEFHSPDWALGQSTMTELPDGSIVCRMRRSARDHLVRLRPPTAPGTWVLEQIEQPCVTISGVASTLAGDRVAVLGASAVASTGVYEVELGREPPSREPMLGSISDRSRPGVHPEEVSVGRPFVAATPDGPVPGLFYGPTNTAATGPSGTVPPLVVFCHGGPTGACEPGFDPVVQFFTSRGLAVAGVDYRGSSGYGREYRRRLRGAWGVADVDDCVAYARALTRAGWVDGRHMAIRGTSAGGLTALGALIRSERFAGGVAWYGVTDLEALASDTHDFESRYLDSLVGPLPDALASYRERSPLHHPERVSGSVLLLQGSDDPVVPAAQSKRFADALERHGVPCHLQVFAGESHGFRRADTVEACLRAELAFYGAVFGFEPTDRHQQLARDR